MYLYKRIVIIFIIICIDLWKTACFEINISFFHVCFLKCWKRLLIKRLLVKNFKKLLSILHRLQIKQIYGEDFIFKKFQRAHYSCCNVKLIISFSILS